MLRIGIVYFKDPLSPLTGMDLIRWHEISRGLWKLGYQVDMISPQTMTTQIERGLWARRLDEVDWNQYDVVKTRNHSDIELVGDHNFIISRVGRVVDQRKPSREHVIREERLIQQAEIAKRARYVVFTCWENIARWQKIYPNGPRCLLVPTGCADEIPEPQTNPYETNKNVLFLGSLTSSRFAERLNKLGKALQSKGVTLHFMGRNQLDLYGETDEQINTDWVLDHGCQTIGKTWDYIYYADVGIAFARGVDAFDNESSKIYYYLRAGIPVVSEEFVANNFLIQSTGYGAVAKYGNIEDMVQKVLQWIGIRNLQLSSQKYMATTHSWENRVSILARVVDAEMGINLP